MRLCCLPYLTDNQLPALDVLNRKGCTSIAAVIFHSGPVCEWRENGLLVTHGCSFSSDFD
jgi:hypothetical protein